MGDTGSLEGQLDPSRLQLHPWRVVLTPSRVKHEPWTVKLDPGESVLTSAWSSLTLGGLNVAPGNTFFTLGGSNLIIVG